MKPNKRVQAFDTWLSSNYNQIKHELDNSFCLDEDALQDAYIVVREQLAKGIGDFRHLYLQAYRRMSKRNIAINMMYYRPDELFFQFLKNEETEDETQKKDGPTMSIVQAFVKQNSTAEDYQIFTLHFVKGMGVSELCMTSGRSRSYVNNHLKQMLGKCRG